MKFSLLLHLTVNAAHFCCFFFWQKSEIIVAQACDWPSSLPSLTPQFGARHSARRCQGPPILFLSCLIATTSPVRWEQEAECCSIVHFSSANANQSSILQLLLRPTSRSATRTESARIKFELFQRSISGRGRRAVLPAPLTSEPATCSLKWRQRLCNSGSDNRRRVQSSNKS